ncbi:hypothetical protein Acr_20g0012090 [Actinidia rufa]|uniref:Uncharacterized protein n=1 Tax=Actinidia rufa TaxID=165716 RepID=A0A7J0GF58_9ERIC|nr:hypothetical protein Acr_20g0012090 [Actinidia rufa]
MVTANRVVLDEVDNDLNLVCLALKFLLLQFVLGRKKASPGQDKCSCVVLIGRVGGGRGVKSVGAYSVVQVEAQGRLIDSCHIGKCKEVFSQDSLGLVEQVLGRREGYNYFLSSPAGCGLSFPYQRPNHRS